MCAMCAMQRVTQQSLEIPVPRHLTGDVPPRIWRAGLKPSREFLARHAQCWARLVCGLRQEVRSFLGRTRTLLGRKRWLVLLGPALERGSTGHLRSNRDTDARSQSIQQLIARHPWASTIDVEIFLWGFDMGEESARHTVDIPGSVLVPSLISVSGK